jgi:hypothetical protein
MRASTGKIYYTLDSSDPRLAGGSVSKKARLYDSPLTLEQSVQVFARVQHEGRWSGPAVAKFTIAGNASR